MIVLNASNLHLGGGVQVATSFIHELSGDHSAATKIGVIASSKVDASLGSIKCDASSFLTYTIGDVHGLERMPQIPEQVLRSAKTVFTIFGPLYRWSPPFRSIVGFAQPWIIYPRNECYGFLSPWRQLKTRLKFWIQAQFFKRADLLVVELDHVKQGLIRELGIAPERICVVHNCLSSLYWDKTAWQPVAIPQADCDLRLGFVGRNYLHKNTAIFPEIAKVLETVHGVRARFYVTFTDEEWGACSPDFRAVCINVGPLTVAQCPLFYKSLDGVVFPSLLECFSATPLEAMAMEVPLFASERKFNIDVCGEHAHYFDPLVPETAAERIAGVFGAGNRPDAKALLAAREHAIAFSSPAERAKQYLSLLMHG